MKLKAYDKYHKQWVYIIFGEDDEMWDWESSSSNGICIRQHILFQAVEGDKDNCDPKRWSDLEKFEIIDNQYKPNEGRFIKNKDRGHKKSKPCNLYGTI